jgi:hypothetical protein
MRPSPERAFKEPPVELRLDSREERDWTVLDVVGEVDLKVFTVTGLEQLFTIRPSVGEAIRA